MKRLVLAQLHAGRSAERVPLAAGCLASWLEADPRTASWLETRILQADVPVDPKAFATAILDTQPDAVGFSVYSWNRLQVEAVCRSLRTSRPRLFLVAGGPEAPALAAADGTDSSAGASPLRLWDTIVTGEGESALAAALSAYYAGEASVCARTADPIDLATAPSPWLTRKLDPRDYDGCVLWELTRGCPYGCSYCAEGRGDRRVRHMPEARIEAELQHFAASGVSQIFVLDPTFNLDSARAQKLLALFERKAPGIHYHLEVRAELLDKKQAALLGRLDCSLQIGLQSTNPAALAAVNRSLETKTFRRNVALLDEAGVSFGLDLIYGLPCDSLEGFRQSLDFALECQPNNLDIFPLAILPGTGLEAQAGQLGLQYLAQPPYTILSVPGFPERDIEHASQLAAACDLFYTRGRAVGWFSTLKKALGMRPSAIIGAFAAYLQKTRSSGSTSGPNPSMHLDQTKIEHLQLGFLAPLFRERSREALWPAASDFIRFNGAWARALAEGERSRLDLSYDPEWLTDPAILDLRSFVSEIPSTPCIVHIDPGPTEPRIRVQPTKPATRGG